MEDSGIGEVLNLPASTGECDVGPEIVARPGQVSVRYDNEGESGLLWTEIAFRGAIAMRTTPDVSSTEQMISAYSRICEVRASPWLADLREAADDGTIPGDVRHYVVFFDGFGAIEVVARSVDVRPSTGPA